jgi:hypothetical protein
VKKGSAPILFEWSIIRISPADHPEHTRYHFTGIGYGHPRLPDLVQFITTDVQEVSEDQTWGRSRSRVYSLARQLRQEEFSAELATEIKEILFRALGHSFDVAWVSVEEWRAVAGAGRAAGRDDVL